MRTEDFNYDLPDHFIAQEPLEPRDSSKLMVLNRDNQTIEHHIFHDIINYLQSNDVLVINNTRVIPARLSAFKADTGGKMEILLLKKIDDITWDVLVGGKRASVGTQIAFSDSDVKGEVIAEGLESERTIRFDRPIDDYLDQLGEMPLPPYIQKRVSNNERYQTIYSRHEGSAAAPTAGLHFTPDLLIALRDKGVKIAYCTLHIGLDTFQPVKVDDITEHHIHSEWATLSQDDAHTINEAKLAGGRIIAVGTTSARTLETAGILSAGGDPANPNAINNICAWRPVIAFERDTNLFIYPPDYQWRVVDAMITNFHLPKSTLLMMISSFAEREFVLEAYETAKQNNYRFFSFGDAMFIS